MADEEDETEAAAGDDIDGGEGEDIEGGVKTSGKKKLLLALVPLLLIGAAAGGAYYMGYLDSLFGIESGDHAEGEEGEHGGETEHASAGKGDGHGGGHGEGEGSGFIAVPTMIVNLVDEDGETPRYLRLTVQLELQDPEEAVAIEAVIPRVVDQFQTFLRELRVRDLRGSAGIYRLQMELLRRVNQAAYPVEVKDILFQEILIQ
ncbi:MAG: flagellar basal body-associated FliL family protein [Alphaproteobacteria bacterium]|nr:flagellar basal body-associated FliL family protein [Alphaproteobacteria bacterium]